MNKVFLSGKIDKIYDLKMSNKGVSVISFNVKAYNDSFRKSYITLECVLFGENATLFHNNAEEKDYIEIEGRVNKSSYKDKNNNNVYRTNIAVISFEIVTKKVASKENETVKSTEDFLQGTPQYEDLNNIIIDDDSLPF